MFKPGTSTQLVLDEHVVNPAKTVRKIRSFNFIASDFPCLEASSFPIFQIRWWSSLMLEP
jgi:hypothetical protein